MAKGGKREGSGRKSKADELRLSAIMDDIGNTAEVLQVLFEQAKNPKNTADRQLWLAYKYGKPKEHIAHDGQIVTIRYDGGINNLISPATQESADNS